MNTDGAPATGPADAAAEAASPDNALSSDAGREQPPTDTYASNDAARRCTNSSGIMRGDDPTCIGSTLTVANRPYCVHAPGDRSHALPVVLLLHGYRASGQEQSNYFGLDDLVDERQFILVKPNGTTNGLGQRYWNAFPACCAVPNDRGVPDDVAYLSQVLDDVASAYPVDTTRVYAVGHSNGGFMAHRLACDLGTRMAAIVSLAGAVDPTLCHPTRPVSVVEAHGTSDDTIAYGGGAVLPIFPSYVGVEATLGFWATAEGCGARIVAESNDLICDARNEAETSIERYANCAGDRAVELWKLNGQNHIPNFSLPTWPNRILDFLFSQRLAMP